MEHGLALGVAGFVVFGAIRDAGAIGRMALPCHACGITHRGPYKNGPGVLNAPLAIGGDVVMPGDLVLGDEDGVVTLSPETARRILPEIRAREADERERIAAFRQMAAARA
jgi:regulator of RNase E activity RraA